MKFPTRRILAFAVGAVLLAGMVVSQKNNTPEAMLRAAMDKETVDGDLKAAIEQYKKVIAQKTASKEVVATALVRLGVVYEKQASAEARPVYQRVVREFSDQMEAAREARSRLAGTPPNSAEISLRRICSGTDCDGVISPNGRYVINDFGNPIVRDVATGQAHPLTNVPDGYLGRAPKWAPDSNRVAFTESSLSATDGERIVVANLDGTMSRAIFHGERALVCAWSPDGKRILVADYGRGPTTNLLWVGVTDGKLEKLTDRLFVVGASISLDGRYIAYGASKDGYSANGTDLYVMASDGTGETAIVASPTSGLRLPVGWTPDGKYLIFAQRELNDPASSLWAVPISGGKPGVSVKVQVPVGKAPVGFDGLYAGTLYFRTLVNTADILTASMDPGTGKIDSPAVPLPVSHNERMGQPHWSPDGRKIVYYSGGNELSVYSFDGGKDQRVASTIASIQFEACWAADGASILINGPRASDSAQTEPMRVSLNTGDATRLFPGGTTFRIRTCSKDLVADMDNTNIKVRNLKSGSETVIHKYGRRQTMPGLPYLSHDARSVAFTEVLEDGSTALFIVSTEGGSVHELARVKSPMAFVRPRGIEWSIDDRFVYFVKRPDSKVPTELFRVSVSGGNEESTGLKLPDLVGVEISLDGKHIALNTNGGQRTETWAMANFLPTATTKK